MLERAKLILKTLFCSKNEAEGRSALLPTAQLDRNSPIGIIAGSGTLPLRFVERAKKAGHKVIAVCHEGESSPTIEQFADLVQWIKVGQLGKIIETFQSNNVAQAVMLGGINRVKLFGGVKLDPRGAALLLKLRSGKDDVIMRGVAQELEREGIAILPCSTFFEDEIVRRGVITKTRPCADELNDIEVGKRALVALSAQDIGQLIVVKDGVITAVEAVEGSDKAIIRGGELAGRGAVVVKCAKVTQDLRFDVPTVGVKTIETMTTVQARVLALEAGRCMLLDSEQFIDAANKAGISVIGIEPL